ncbi:hypothetical protein [Halomonas lysinitropha]|uniref:hypothetical protein n=1 Tax=Halomonas lysinitropha TaxID=2607506 RepID=UPI00124A70D3|nr:hypothetical protein [Halomonas lysinitropha]
MKKLIHGFIVFLALTMAEDVLAEAPTRALDKSSPKLMERANQSEQIRTRKTLRARDFERLVAQPSRDGKPIPGASSSLRPVDQMPPPGQAYEIEDCGEGLVCCSYTGSASTCNLFMYLCASHGGQATGDPNEAVCKF